MDQRYLEKEAPLNIVRAYHQLLREQMKAEADAVKAARRGG